MNGVYFYFVNKLFLVGRYWDFKDANRLDKSRYIEHTYLFARLVFYHVSEKAVPALTKKKENKREGEVVLKRKVMNVIERRKGTCD